MTTFWQNISDAVSYYQENGFTYVEVPWIVDERYNLLSCKDDNKILYCAEKEKIEKKEFPTLVGSAEQSFLSILKELEQHKDYVAVSPCFRPQDNSPERFSYPYFMKVELFSWFAISKKEMTENSLGEPNKIKAANHFVTYIAFAEDLFHRFGVNTSVEYISKQQSDLVTKKEKVEMGSYGYRIVNVDNEPCVICYGTGLAEPRFSNFIEETFKPSYHKKPILKGDYGKSSKIIEEVREYEEAVRENATLVALCELADIKGAVDALIEKFLREHVISKQAIERFSRQTRESFSIGKRS